ncbi:cobalamin B12-binding domain-containing protein [Actinoallomurus rhizosphaericola]|uniref:cobalamin B12-binding domain-containing protein n=1 Tax=Actinoallomurus rhizosphaericola TaxID=2952536 RepID=UPI00209082D6|nr:cobalamin-dependent protein [Actinoallomurus rhizosphaericola]MCO5994313.1 cobalamin-dependent protein [Actinoallomurus rhizosphaericola]
MTASAPDRKGTEVLSARLWDVVRGGDEYAAVEIVLSAVDAGLDAESALLDVVAPVQGKVGVEWAANRLSVAEEHTASAINDRVIAALAHHGSAPRRSHQGRITVACVDGEWHALPARLLAETLRLRGWQIDFLGAQVPVPHLIDHLHRTGPDALALSSSIPTRLPAAHTAIRASQAAGVPVIAGGAAFGPGGCYADRLGADAWAPDARAAADRLAEIVARPYVPPAAHEPLDDLPHLADQEYTLVTRNTHRLVAAVLAAIEERFPAMAGYSERQRRHTAEDIAHITEFLATALYLDDSGLFTRFIAWTADILAARGVPAHSLTLGLDLLTEQLTDLPRAVALLRDGRAAVPLAR